jgi:hypothetical protein
MVQCTFVLWTKVQLRQLLLTPQTRRMGFPGIESAALTAYPRNRTLDASREEGVQLMKISLEFLAIAAAIALAGCAESASQPYPSCELMTAQICSRAAESKLHDGTLTVSYSFRPEEARVVPFVVPLMRPDGVLATEVDCYANTDSRTYSIVRSDLAIPPRSDESVDFLRTRHLCTDDGSFAKDEGSRVETASTLHLISR